MMTRRSTGNRLARALWYARKGVVELRAAPLPRPQPGEAAVRALFSGISRGTERLVFNGAVGRSEWERMRCPNQQGAFPFPVKYGYCATAVFRANGFERRFRDMHAIAQQIQARDVHYEDAGKAILSSNLARPPTAR